MKVPMTATKSLIYAGRRLKPGDQFEAARMDARLLAAIRKATYRTAAVDAAPVQKVVTRSPLDHDGDGRPGGSPRPDDPAGDLAALRAQYQDIFGKRPFHGWDAETLRAKIAAHGAGEA